MNYLRSMIILIFIISTVIFQYLILLLKYEDILMSFAIKQFQETRNVYDYIIVGAGSAGSVIAHRLGRNRNFTILLLEAGPHIGSLIDIPVITPLLHQTSLNWRYETVPQKYSCFGLTNNRSRWPMAKVTGGTSRLNNMLHTIGHPSDYEEWYKYLDDYDYAKDVLYYHKKAVGYPYDGSIHLTNEIHTTVADYILNATKFLGYDERNVNVYPHTGFMKPQVTLKDGKRFTTYHHMYNNKGPNLKIETNSHVTKVLFRSNYEAYAVLYKSLGRYYKARARKGIVLSAGVIGTPKILMLSGIGKKDDLNNVNIDCINDLPVGDNLQDHVTTGIDLITLKSNVNFQLDHILSPLSAYRYYFKSDGPWTTTGCEIVGFVNVTSRYPDLELMLIPTGITTDNGVLLRKTLGISDETWNGYFSNVIGNNTITILPVVLHPKSKGTVKLKDKNPFSLPLIDPNYLSVPYDVEMLVKGIEMIKDIINTEPMKRIGASLNDNKINGCVNYKFDTKEYWECYVKYLTITAFHPIGTCKMGTVNDKTTVVNYDFQLINANKLYVTDASVIPKLNSANINAAVIMLAERAADIIKRHDHIQTNKSKRIEIFIKRDRC